MSAHPQALVRSKSGTWTWQLSLILLGLAFLYRDVLARLVAQWWNDPNFSHGFFVPAFAALVIWWDRERLARIPVMPSWFGLPFLAGGLGVLVVGVLGAELFLSRTSLIFVLAGLVVQFLGWGYLRALAFPLLFLFLMIPIPAIVFNQVAFPLQLLASTLAASFLQFVGVPTLRQGNVIQLPVMTLEVVEACSGIRSLITLLTLSVIYGYLMERGTIKRVILALSAIPIAVLSNSLRIVGTGLLGEFWDPEKAQGFFHTFSGWVIFVVSLALLFALHSLMKLFAKKREASA